MNWTGYRQEEPENGQANGGSTEGGFTKPNLDGEVVRIHSVKLLLTSEEKTTRGGMHTKASVS